MFKSVSRKILFVLSCFLLLGVLSVNVMAYPRSQAPFYAPGSVWCHEHHCTMKRTVRYHEDTKIVNTRVCWNKYTPSGRRVRACRNIRREYQRDW